MLKKMISKFKRQYETSRLDFPREYHYYSSRFEANDWVVNRESTSFSSAYLVVYFKGTKIAQTERDEYFPYLIAKLVFEPGFEELKPEVHQVLKAASQKRIDEEQEELKARQELVKQAKTETKFLGPF